MIEQESAELDKRALTGAAFGSWLWLRAKGGKVELNKYLRGLGLLEKDSAGTKMTTKEKRAMARIAFRKARRIMAADKKLQARKKK